MAPEPPGRSARRAALVALIAEVVPGGPARITDDTRLITSGLLESAALLDLALWVEREVGGLVELSAFDLAEEWDTPMRILDFIERRRPAQKDIRSASS